MFFRIRSGRPANVRTKAASFSELRAEGQSCRSISFPPQHPAATVPHRHAGATRPTPAPRRAWCRGPSWLSGIISVGRSRPYAEAAD